MVSTAEQESDYFGPQQKNFDYFVFANGEKMDPEESKRKLEAIMEDALGVLVKGEIDENCNTISETIFDPKTVMAVTWQKGTAVVWDNSRFLHSTTPATLYSPGRRVMYQIIHNIRENSFKSWN